MDSALNSPENLHEKITHSPYSHAVKISLMRYVLNSTHTDNLPVPMSMMWRNMPKCRTCSVKLSLTWEAWIW